MDDDLHRFWTCPANGRLGDSAVKCTQHLVSVAAQEASSDPLLWLRGVAVNKFSCGDVEPPEPTALVQFLGLLRDCDKIEVPFVFTDGSGGSNSRDPRKRRVGFGFAAFEHASILSLSPYPVAAGFGTLPGPKQTVPRAELYAIIVIAKCTVGDVTVYTDHINHVNKFSRGEMACLCSELSDLWAVIFDVLRDRAGKFCLDYVPAHATLAKFHEMS